MFTYAITRRPGPNFDQGLTTANLGHPSYPLILEQHQDYVDTLRQLGLDVIVLEYEPDYPDAYFVEDIAIVTPNVAVITRPGAPSRRGEDASIEPILAQYRPIHHITRPGTLDGGDVLRVGNHFFIGASLRTNREGASQLTQILNKYEHTAEVVSVASGLHLKSSINTLGDNRLLLTADLADYPCFTAYERLVIVPGEEYAANTLRINDTLLTPKGFPQTLEQLCRLGLQVIEMDVSEVRKMDGGLTCMSLRF